MKNVLIANSKGNQVVFELEKIRVKVCTFVYFNIRMCMFHRAFRKRLLELVCVQHLHHSS